MIFASQIAISGRLDVSGDDGQDGAGNHGCGMGCGSGGGGAGAGGALYFETQHIAITGTVSALGGKGGNCSCNGVGGGWHMPPMMYAPAGDGGAGRISTHGATVTGTTMPPLVAG
jgi:hypothetical protein